MKTEIEGDWARIIPPGSINITNAEKLRNEFNQLLNRGFSQIILDLKNVDDIDSAALGKILVIENALKKEDGNLIIENVNSENVRKVFDTVNLGNVIEIKD